MGRNKTSSKFCSRKRGSRNKGGHKDIVVAGSASNKAQQTESVEESSSPCFSFLDRSDDEGNSMDTTNIKALQVVLSPQPLHVEVSEPPAGDVSLHVGSPMQRLDLLTGYPVPKLIEPPVV